MPIFSFVLKMVERVMYNLLYKLLTDQKILYSEQLGFQKGNTTDHIFLHSSLIKFLRLFNKINIHFGFLLICLKLLILLIICIKLLILFDTLNYRILLSNLELWGIRGKYLKWSENYVGSRMQYIQINSLENTLFHCVKWRNFT